MICVLGLDAVLVAVRQHRQLASALDSGIELALVNRASACQTGWNDFAVFGQKVAQSVDIFVINLNNVSYRETAVTLALEQQGLGIALWALIGGFLKT
jgi:hypothetical protein